MNYTDVLEQLRAIATGETQHVYNGLCPDQVEGPAVRDDACPACRVLLAADSLLHPATR
jgi:hypothetical protein